jgi:large subunit ribosomal protein L4
MDVPVKTLAGEDAGTVTLPEETFGLEPRADILHRVVRWQLARRQTGSHKVKTRGEIAATGKKMYRQKGTGRARHSDRKATQFRGGAKPHGPKVRSHAHDLPKKVRALGLRHALSAKAKEADIVVLDSATVDEAKTKALRERLAALGLSDALVVDGEVDGNLAKAARNLPAIDVLPLAGINVYDILRRDKLVLTRAAVDGLSARFAGAKMPAARDAADAEGEVV